MLRSVKSRADHESALSAASADARADWQRARRPEHKEERRQAILDAATALLDSDGVEGASLTAIARRAGLSKANLYRYFESREAILLAVMLDEVRDWTRAIASGLAPLAGSRDIEAIAEVFTETLVARPRLCMLMGSLWAVLERNVGPDTVAVFKQSFAGEVFGPVEALLAALPDLSPEQGAGFARFFFLFAAGTWPAANPAPVVTEVLAREEFAGMCIDFEPMLRDHARVVLRGLLAG